MAVNERLNHLKAEAAQELYYISKLPSCCLRRVWHVYLLTDLSSATEFRLLIWYSPIEKVFLTVLFILL